MSTAPVWLDGLAEAARGCEACILDLWGTVHDGVALYPGARDALDGLARAGIPVALLSNAPRPARFEAERLDRLGIGRDRYAALVTAGETWRRWFAREGKGPLAHCGPALNLCLFEGLAVAAETPLEACRALVVSDLDPALGDVEGHRGLLAAALARGLPVHCINPDLRAAVPGGEVARGGTVGRLYRDMGGEVLWFGKPEAIAFEAALAALGGPDRRRTLCIGDSIATDVAGAAAVGLRTALVLTGRESARLPGAASPQARLAQLAPLLPPGTLVLDALRW